MLFFDDTRHVKKQRAACVGKAASATRDGKSLARKTRAQHVVVGNVAGGYLDNVALRPLTKVGVVGFLGGGVDFAGKYAPTAQILQRNSEPTNARKQINESELRI